MLFQMPTHLLSRICYRFSVFDKIKMSFCAYVNKVRTCTLSAKKSGFLYTKMTRERFLGWVLCMAEQFNHLLAWGWTWFQENRGVSPLTKREMPLSRGTRVHCDSFNVNRATFVFERTHLSSSHGESKRTYFG